jgi:acetyl-CoA C-acetyltransferase
MTDSIVIVSARRTAVGSFQGQFAPVKSPELGAAAIRAALSDAGIGGEDVSEVIMGCVLPAGVGQAPARQASLGAGACRSAPVAPPSTRSADRA